MEKAVEKSAAFFVFALSANGLNLHFFTQTIRAEAFPVRTNQTYPWKVAL